MKILSNHIRIKSIIAIAVISVCATFTFSSCDSSFNVNSEWQDIPVVYCVLDQSQEYQYVKLNKSFLGNIPASEMASVSDSLFYNTSIKVMLYEKNGSQTTKSWEFTAVDSIKKNDGYFATDKNTIWVAKPVLKDDRTYELEITIGDGDNAKVVKGSTSLVNGVRISNPTTYVKYIELSRYNNDFSPKYFPGKNANVFQFTVNFNYLEIKNNGDTIRKSIEFYNSTTYKSNVTDDEVKLAFSVASFYSAISAQISADDATVVKRLVCMPNSITFNIAAADENFYTYMQVTQPATGIAQEKPSFTNIDGGFGLMASRYNSAVSKALGHESLDSISKGQYTKNLKFPFWGDNYYTMNQPY